ncbi:MAG: dihydropteroate synthase [Maricaulaceae bacterium]
MFKRPKIMGILNVTPDSFSDGGRYDSLDVAVKQALELIDQGADIIDIGGESTRPGAEEISVKEEVRRTVPVIIELRDATRDFDIGPIISIDTRKPEVAEAAVLAGADIWNDVSALTFDKRSEAVAADLACPLILMHAQGKPETMQNNPHYDNPVFEVKDWLAKRLDACEFAGIDRDMITLDPGIGFGKRQEDNLALLRELASLKALGCPVLMGASRKSFIGKIDGSSADDRLGGSLAAALWSAQAGADILRVHDVSETVQAMKVWEAIANGN